MDDPLPDYSTGELASIFEGMSARDCYPASTKYIRAVPRLAATDIITPAIYGAV